MEATNTTQSVKVCGCGCGAEVRRRYLSGHDAKHKSALVAGLRSADWRVRTASADALYDLGWTQFADLADLRAVPYRTSNGLAVQHVEEVSVWQVDSCGQHHSHRNCPALTAQARRDGQLTTGGRASSEAVALVANSPETAQRLRNSWDLCTTCSTDWSRDEEAESAQLSRQLLADCS